MGKTIMSLHYICPSLDNISWISAGIPEVSLMRLCLCDYIDLITLTEMQTPSPYTESYYIASWRIYTISFIVFESSDSNLLEILMVCNFCPTCNHDD